MQKNKVSKKSDSNRGIAVRSVGFLGMQEFLKLFIMSTIGYKPHGIHALKEK